MKKSHESQVISRRTQDSIDPFSFALLLIRVIRGYFLFVYSWLIFLCGKINLKRL